MKICHMTSAHTNLDIRIFHKECVSLARAGYDTYLVAPGESFDRDGVHIIGTGLKSTSRLKRMTQDTKKVYAAARALDADLYHLHDPELLPYALKLKRQGKHVIFDSHENYSLQIKEKSYLPTAVRTLIAGCYHTYETHVLKNIDAVIIPCTIQGQNIFEHRARKTVYIANYPLPEEFCSSGEHVAAQPHYICYVGSITCDRGIIPLIEACEKANTKLVLAGAFSPPELEQELQALPGYRMVDYRGIVDRKAVAEINTHALAGAQTLLKKGQYDKVDTFGIKVFEYMAMGLPVILSNFAYTRKVFEHYRFGICIDPDDTQSIADAIVTLLKSPELARELGNNGKRAIQDEFNWATQETKLLELYDTLLI